MKDIRIEDQDLGISADDGPFRSYSLSTEGECIVTLCENASICEIDQDGGEISTEGLYDCSGAVIDAAEKMIARTFLAAHGYKTTYDKKESMTPKSSCI